LLLYTLVIVCTLIIAMCCNCLQGSSSSLLVP
jgi:hypothetical protein